MFSLLKKNQSQHRTSNIRVASKHSTTHPTLYLIFSAQPTSHTAGSHGGIKLD